jgi:hypothetical protein
MITYGTIVLRRLVSKRGVLQSATPLETKETEMTVYHRLEPTLGTGLYARTFKIKRIETHVIVELESGQAIQLFAKGLKQPFPDGTIASLLSV